MAWIDAMEKDSVICFLGDSITANGSWESEVFSYLIEHYKEKHLTLYNCGLSGDNAGNALKRIYRDCLCYSPDYVVVMLGMNDIGQSTYNTDTEENIKKRKECIARYKENMQKLYDIILRKNRKLILCTPTISGNIPKGNQNPGNFMPGLEACAEFVRVFAERNGCMLIDFNREMRKYADKEIISADYVHPTEYGYHIMAQLFMVAMGMKDSVDEEPYLEKNEKNKDRFEMEKLLTDMRFCERAMIWQGTDADTLTIEERKKWMDEFAKEEIAYYWKQERVHNYLKIADHRDTYKGKLVELTYAVYEN